MEARRLAFCTTGGREVGLLCSWRQGGWPFVPLEARRLAFCTHISQLLVVGCTPHSEVTSLTGWGGFRELRVILQRRGLVWVSSSNQDGVQSWDGGFWWSTRARGMHFWAPAYLTTPILSICFSKMEVRTIPTNRARTVLQDKWCNFYKVLTPVPGV